VELITGNITIKHILQHNNNWQNFYDKYSHLIRDAIPWNIDKIFNCRTQNLGFHKYQCLDCGKTVTVPHTCKSRFCSSCGALATDNWISSNLNEFLDVPYKHLVFTIPSEIRTLILHNRKLLLNCLFKSASKTVLSWSNQNKSYIPGIIMVLHTFGRDLKFNPHIHMIITCGGLNLDNSKWISISFIPHLVLKTLWRYQIISSLRSLFKEHSLVLPESQQFSNLASFNKFLNRLYSKTWYVNIGKSLSDPAFTVKYIGRYTKRPVIAETRITAYDDHYVHFNFKDHANNRNVNVKLSVQNFIARIICHIPDKHFRQIRYSGIFACSVKTRSLSIARNLLGQLKQIKPATLSWRNRKIKSSGFDPLFCLQCGISMTLASIGYFKNGKLKTIYLFLLKPIFLTMRKTIKFICTSCGFKEKIPKSVVDDMDMCDLAGDLRFPPRFSCDSCHVGTMYPLFYKNHIGITYKYNPKTRTLTPTLPS